MKENIDLTENRDFAPELTIDFPISININRSDLFNNYFPTFPRESRFNWYEDGILDQIIEEDTYRCMCPIPWLDSVGLTEENHLTLFEDDEVCENYLLWN